MTWNAGSRSLDFPPRGLIECCAGLLNRQNDLPVTPFHFGPGALITAATRGKVSFLAFAATNVLIDGESLYNMLTGQPRIHTFLHTYLGATLAAAFTTLAFLAVRKLLARASDSRIFGWRRLRIGVVISGSLIGAWSHVVLDSIMHGDITPLAPFSGANALYRLVSTGTLHLFCVGAGALGIACYMLRSASSRKRVPPAGDDI
jgi:hypothetical protein